MMDYDDTYDCTYAYIEYSIPEKYQDECKRMSSGVEPETIGDKFEKVFKIIEAPILPD